jgi:hypothetical protein
MKVYIALGVVFHESETMLGVFSTESLAFERCWKNYKDNCGWYDRYDIDYYEVDG